MTSTDEFQPTAGASWQLADDLALVLAPNPSPMTAQGTNTYLLGRDVLAVIDPGPDDARHLNALMAAIADRPVSHIFVTHSHLDHSPLADALSQKTDAQIYAFGDSLAGRSAVMAQLAVDGMAGGGEGVDHKFRPDQCLDDGQTVTGQWGQLTALHTPGHMGNHLCFAWQDIVFTGDHVMGWASSMVSPPDGDLGDFMRSCQRLQSVPAAMFYPAHGAPIADPAARLAWLIAHRQSREAGIIDQLRNGPATTTALTKKIYHDTPDALLPAAARNVFAHLVDLTERGEINVFGTLTPDATFCIAQAQMDTE